MKPWERVKRAFLPLRLAHLLMGGRLYLSETRESICPVKPEVFLSMYRSGAVIRHKL